MTQGNLGLFDTPPSRKQVRLSIAVVAVLFIGLALVLLVQDVQLGPIDAFIPMIDATTSLIDLIIATLLYVQASVFRSRALTALASGYVFTALVLVPHALTFPGAFAPTGLLGAGISTTAWLYIFWRAAFPTAAILYIIFDRVGSPEQPAMGQQSGKILWGILTAAGLAAIATILATLGHDWLPALFRNRSDVNVPTMVAVTCGLIVLFVVAMAMLIRRRKSVLDMWLLVVLSAWLVQTLLLLSMPGRFTVGWYATVILVLLSHLVLMLALIAESSRLYARLALSTAARNRERDARLMSMDTVAAAIAHEVGQPLAAVNMNAMAGLNWLRRDEPNAERAIEALFAVVDAGQRTSDVIKNTRGIFTSKPGTATELSLNDLVRETASLLDRELASEKVSLQLELDETLPPITANRVQLQQVLTNLFTNAIESLGATRRGPRQITIRSAQNGEDVQLDFGDTGIGIDEDAMAQIFDSFFTTKATGTGLGLSLCRTIVEHHGGRLWASPGTDHGATFHIRLPCTGLRHPELTE